MREFHFLAGLLFVSLTFSLHAFERDHGAHEHGHAMLMMVEEGNELHISLQSPAMNIVGFEHQPSNASQRQQVNEARSRLENGAALFGFSQQAECKQEHVKVVSALLLNEESAMDSSHHHDHKDLDKHEDLQQEHGHHNAHEHHDGPKTVHSEFEVEYHFVCESLGALRTVSVGLFRAFPGIEEIEVQIANKSGQKLIELNAGNPSLNW